MYLTLFTTPYWYPGRASAHEPWVRACQHLYAFMARPRSPAHSVAESWSALDKWRWI